LTTTITLHALSTGTPNKINTAHIREVVQARFGGCGIWFFDKAVPLHFWESREHVLKLINPTPE
jgi:hypothetical protein